MPVDVVCPKCQSRLRAPENVIGKVVRCKKCREKFRAGGGDAPESSMGDTQLLSTFHSKITLPEEVIPKPAVAEPATPPQVAPTAASLATNPAPADDLIVLDEPAAPPAVPISSDLLIIDTPVVPAAAIPKPEAAFAFDEPAPETTKGAKGEKGKKKSQGDETPIRKETAKKGGSKLLLVLLLVGSFLALGIVVAGGGLYWYFTRKPEVVNKSTTNQPVSKVEPNPKGGKEKETKDTGNATPKGPKQPGTTPPKIDPPKPPEVPVTKLPDAPATPQAFVKSKQDRILEIKPEAVRDVRIAGNEPVFALVVHNVFAGFQGKGATDAFERVSLSTGAKAGRIDLAVDGLAWPRPLALSADGRIMAVEAPLGKLTVHDFDNKQKSEPFDNSGKPFQIASLFFVNNDLLAVVDTSGALQTWNIKTRKVLFRGEGSAVTGNPAIASPISAKAAAVFQAGKFWIATVDAPPSQPITVGEEKFVGLALAIDPAGKQAAVVYRSADVKPKLMLSILSLEKGSLVRTVPLPDAAGTPRTMGWPADQTLLITFNERESSLIIDTENYRPVAYLKPKSGRNLHLPIGASGTYWWLQADPKMPAKSLLIGVDMPFDGFNDLAASTKTNNIPVYLVPDATGILK